MTERRWALVAFLSFVAGIVAAGFDQPGLVLLFILVVTGVIMRWFNQLLVALGIRQGSRG